MGKRVRRWIPWAALLMGIVLGGGVPWMVTVWWIDEPPEIRAFQVGDKPSALIVDGDSRILLIQLDDREEAARAFGVMARPWEPRPQMLIAPADDRLAVGLWEALQHFEPASVLVLGVAGSAPLWAQVEDECRARGIELRFVAGVLSFQIRRLQLTVFGADDGGGGLGAVVVRRDDMNVLIEAGEPPPDVAAQLVIGVDFVTPPEPAAAVTSMPAVQSEHVRRVMMQEQEVIHVGLLEGHMRVRGGVLLDALGTIVTPTPE